MTHALVATFVANAPTRLTQLGECIAALDSEANPVLLRQIARELHTFKGEARLLELGAIEALAHAAEDVLASHQRAKNVGLATQTLLYEAVDAMFTCVQAAGAQETTPDDIVSATLEKLRANILTVPAALLAPLAEEVSQAMPEVVSERGTATVRFSSIQSDVLERMADLSAQNMGLMLRNRNAIEHLWRQVKLLGNANMDVSLRSLAATVASQTRQLREHIADDQVGAIELKDVARNALMRPLSQVLATFPSFARQAAQQLGKDINLQMDNLNLQLEERVLQEIAEPSMHLLRNAIAHGIESPADRRSIGKAERGLIVVSAAQEGDMVRLSIADDGRGLDVDRISERAVSLQLITREALAGLSEHERMRLAFEPGLSTQAQANDIAGRGVGLDVVKAVLQRMGGSVEIDSRPGKGCTFILRVPVSKSMIRLMLVRACDQTFGIPSADVVEVFWLSTQDIQAVQGGGEVTTHRDAPLRLVRLRQALRLTGVSDIFVNKVHVVVVDAGGQRMGLIVDRCTGEREVMMQAMDALVQGSKACSGLALLEDDAVVVVVQPDELQRLETHTDTRQACMVGAHKERILYAEDSVITRDYTSAVLLSHGFDVTCVGDGVEALAALEAGRYDLLLTDLQMPNMDGFKLIGLLRRSRLHRGLPIVIMSTISSEDTRSMALHSGADAYIVKSAFSSDVILEVLAGVLRKYAKV